MTNISKAFQVLNKCFVCQDRRWRDEAPSQSHVSHEELNKKLTVLAKERSRELDEYLLSFSRSSKVVLKIVLLGSPSSGKSTVFKQIDLLYRDSYIRPDHSHSFREKIYENVFIIYKKICLAASDLNFSLDIVETIMKDISEKSFNGNDFVTNIPMLSSLLQQFWKSTIVQLTYQHRYSLNLPDSTKYFMDNMNRIGSLDYEPIWEDILRIREVVNHVRTEVYPFERIKFRVIDVGNQKSLRRKWLHVFDDASVIIYVVDLLKCIGSYTSTSDIIDTKLTVSQFADIVQNRLLSNSTFLLLLNKFDMFQDFINTTIVNYEQPELVEFTFMKIREQFLEAAQFRKHVYSHSLVAVEIDDAKKVLNHNFANILRIKAKAVLV
ncbi:unnamed protein product [Auanema sp. JU1783]|nr:unnamed protein product [Auanema sp. JU1783]